MNPYPDCEDVLVGGDLNVPILTLGYSRESERTDILLDYLALTEMNILNDIHEPATWTHGGISGRPDVTLGGRAITEAIDGWTVDDKNFSYSDHRYVLFLLNFKPIIGINRRFKTKNKSYGKFNRKVEQHKELAKAISDQHQLDDGMNSFCNILESIRTDCFRTGNITYKPKLS